MGDPIGFLNNGRKDNPYRAVNQRILDFGEIEEQLPIIERQLQASRCMDCGVPFCHWECPISNLIPEWQDKLYQGDWKSAYELLQRTNNFPEFTGRACPAPCEASCVLEINDQSVTIRANELAIIEHAFGEGYVQPKPPLFRTGKKIAVIGSGPAGLACADLLNKMGHDVTLYEADKAVGGYLRYGIPDFKLDKNIIDRRVNLLKQEGLIIKTGTKVGTDISVDKLISEFDAVSLAIGTRVPRDLPIKGRDLDGIHFAVDFLTQQNQTVARRGYSVENQVTATGKHVVVIGGGDTGADCVGTAIRQGAKSVTQLEILPQPPNEREVDNPWPLWPQTFRTSSSHKEGCERHFSITTKKFLGKGRVQKLITAKVEWEPNKKGGYTMNEVPNSEKRFDADLVLLAMGFIQVEKDGLVSDLNIEVSPRGNIVVDDNYMTNVPGIFAAGDAQRGPSLIVWGIHEGRVVAENINRYLDSKS